MISIVRNVRRTTGAGALALVTAFVGWAAPASAAGEPDTELITYSWSHTAHLATFNFGSDDPDASFDCSLTAPGQPAAWEGCLNPTNTQYSSLEVGDYLFRVRARNSSGVDPTPAGRLFNIGVDTVDPQTSLTATASTTSRDASFGFTSSEAGTFECRFGRDNVWETRDFVPCTSPVVRTGLADSSYAFEVRAVDLHGQYDASPARHQWLLDVTAPETSMSRTTDGSNASFSFSSPEGNFSCTLVGPSKSHGWQPCSSPTKYADLAPGSYTWQVAAYDRHGNVDATPEVHTWKVLPSTGKVKGSAKVRQGQVARFKLSSPDVGAKYQCSLDKGTWRTCKTRHKVRTDRLRPGKHVLRVRVRAGGLTDPTPVKKKFRVLRARR